MVLCKKVCSDLQTVCRMLICTSLRDVSFNSMHKPIVIYYVSKLKILLISSSLCELCCNYSVVYILFHKPLLMKLLMTLIYICLLLHIIMFINGLRTLWKCFLQSIVALKFYSLRQSTSFMIHREKFCKISLWCQKWRFGWVLRNFIHDVWEGSNMAAYNVA